MEHYKGQDRIEGLETLVPVGDARRYADDYFPTRFDFFSYGRVESVARPCELRELIASPFLLTFRVTGEETGLCVVAFDSRPLKEDDASMYTEIANILVGKLVNALAEMTGGGLQLTPPEQIALGERKHRYLIATFQAARPGAVPAKRYEYITEAASRHTLRLAFLPSTLGPGAAAGGTT